MEKFIEIYDDILPKEIINLIEDLVLTNPQIPLYYTHNVSGVNKTTFSPAFSIECYNPKNNIITPYSHLFLEIVYRLGQFTNTFIENVIQSRLFLHLPSPNPGLDDKHIDLDFPHWVCLYYINDSEGDTVLFNDKDEEIKRVTPKKGRIVFFDGSIKHCSSRPSSKTRAILNFDFLGRKF